MTRSTAGSLEPHDRALFTGRYELALLQGYYESTHTLTATFTLSFRGPRQIAATRLLSASNG